MYASIPLAILEKLMAARWPDGLSQPVMMILAIIAAHSAKRESVTQVYPLNIFGFQGCVRIRDRLTDIPQYVENAFVFARLGSKTGPIDLVINRKTIVRLTNAGAVIDLSFPAAIGDGMESTTGEIILYRDPTPAQIRELLSTTTLARNPKRK